MKLKSFSLTAAAFAASVLAASVHAQPFSPAIGDGGGTIDQQVIGDTNASADHTQSTSNQIGNAANANGATITTGVDTRDQNTNNVSPTATGGNATGNLSNNDNRSSVGNTSASNGQANTGTVGNTTATTGPSTSNSGGNTLGGASSSTGAISNQNAASGGKGGAGGAGGLAAQGQQQGIAGSGNSDNRNALTGGAQTNAQRTSAGNGAGAGAGSGNQTANTTRVDASDRSTTNNSYKAVAWAPIINGPAAPALAAANLVVIPGQCGPRVRVVASNVVGKQFGPFGGQYDVVQGQDTDTVMAQSADGQYEPYIILGDDVWGQRVDRAIGVLGTSSATNFSLGGFTSKGDAAQGGAGGSGSLQQIVARSFVTDCVIGKVIKPVVVKQVLVEAKPIRE